MAICPQCALPGATRHGTRPGTGLSITSGLLTRHPEIVQRFRCAPCNLVFRGGPSLREVETRDAVVEQALIHGLAGAADRLGCDPRTIGAMMTAFVESRSSELPVLAPDKLAVFGFHAAGGARVMAIDLNRRCLVDVFPNLASFGEWRGLSSPPELVVIDFDARVLALIDRVLPHSVVAVSPSATRHAVESAALKGLRALLRVSAGSGRNAPVSVAVFRKREADLDAGDRDEISMWPMDVRRLRAVREAVLDAIDAPAARRDDLLARAEATLREHAPGSALAALLATWGGPIRAGLAERWVDDAVLEADSLRRTASRLRPRGSYDVVRVLLVFTVPPELHDNGDVAGRPLDDVLRRLSRAPPPHEDGLSPHGTSCAS